MARPKKPEVGTPRRLRMDLADFGKVYEFIEARIARAERRRGSKAAALKAAAKKFRIDPKTAERRYNRVRRSMDVDPVLAAIERAATNDPMREAQEAAMRYAADGQALIEEVRPKVLEQWTLFERAFTKEERQKLRCVELQFVLRLAAERIELIQLRKLKRKRQ
jgi:hypothetical protein